MSLDEYYYSQSYLLQTLYEYGLVCCAAVFYFQFVVYVYLLYGYNSTLPLIGC